MTTSTDSQAKSGGGDADASKKKQQEELSSTLEALKIIKEAQQQHGLRHMDYMRYRSYCTRRIRRLRKTMHLLCGGPKKGFHKRDIGANDLQATGNKCLLIPLFQAERAWAYAMQLKQESNTETRKRFHLANRLRKAVRFASELEKLVAGNDADARTRLEAQGYASWMLGQLHFEKQRWADALHQFTLAKQIYEKLAKEVLEGDEQAQPFYVQRAEEIVPNIRYCNYRLGDETAKKDLVDMRLKRGAVEGDLAESIDALISQTKEKQIKTFGEVPWRAGIKLQVKHERVRLFLLNVQEHEKQVAASADTDVKLNVYESMLRECVDVIQLLRDELKTDNGFKYVQRGQPLPPDEKPSNLLLLFSYLTWIKINKTIERSLLLIDSYKQSLLNKQQQQQQQDWQTPSASTGKAVKPQDIVRLYDIIIQNINDMSNLPGLMHDQQLQQENESLVIYYKTFRVFYISLFYLANKSYRVAAGFCFRCDKYLKEQLAAYSKGDKADELKELQTALSQTKYKIQTEAIIEDSAAAGADLEQQFSDDLQKLTLHERLEHYYEDPSLKSKQPNVVRMPLQSGFEAVACKPIFFDLAFNHVTLPSLEDKIATGQAGQAGVKGLLKGWLGFR